MFTKQKNHWNSGSAYHFEDINFVDVIVCKLNTTFLPEFPEGEISIVM